MLAQFGLGFGNVVGSLERVGALLRRSERVQAASDHLGFHRTSASAFAILDRFVVGRASDPMAERLPRITVVAKSGRIEMTTTADAGGCYE